MNDRLTINRKFHVATKRCGTKQFQVGAASITPAGYQSQLRISHFRRLAGVVAIL